MYTFLCFRLYQRSLAVLRINYQLEAAKPEGAQQQEFINILVLYHLQSHSIQNPRIF